MCDNSYNNERCIIIDESGNLGSGGRYFVIACIDTYKYKSIHNIMTRKLGVAYKLFPEIKKTHSHEIKAADAYPCVKHHILECISAKDIEVSYIVLDKKYAKPSLMADKNIMYNYLSKLLLDRLLSKKDSGNAVHIICDNHTTKISSINSFADYVKVHFNYELQLDINLDIKYLDSDSKNAYVIQAADYVANAIWTKYEYNYGLYANVINNNFINQIEFPSSRFGK